MGATHDSIPSPLSDVVRRELFFTFQDGGFTIAFIETLKLNTDIIAKTKLQVWIYQVPRQSSVSSKRIILKFNG